MKSAEWLSERMVFGVLIIGGSIGLLFEIVIAGPKLPAEIVTLASLGLGGLITSLGTIVAAIWKTDKVDRQAADTAAILAAKAPDQSGTGAGTTQGDKP